MKQKVPSRQCIGCHISKPKKELVRIVKQKDGNIVLDVTGKMNGRGAYICKSGDCLEKAIKSRGLNRAFKMEVASEVYDALTKEMNEYDG